MVLSGWEEYTLQNADSLPFLPFQTLLVISPAWRADESANKYKAYGSVGALPSLDLLGLGGFCAFLEHAPYVCSF